VAERRPQHAREAERDGSSETSGSDVTTLAPASVPAARSQGSASP